MVQADDANAVVTKGVVTAAPMKPDSHNHMAECLASVLAASLGLSKYHQIMVKGYPGFVNAMGEKKLVSLEGTSAMSQSKKEIKSEAQKNAVEKETNKEYAEKWATDVRPKFGKEYWKKGEVGMVSIPSKLLNDYWFNSKGQLVRQHISLKPTFMDSAKSFFSSLW